MESDEPATVTVSIERIREETRCPICLGVLKNTRLVKDCLHRFCAECIERSLRINNNECPACRVHLASRRRLQPDPAFDALIAALYGDVAAFEAAEDAAVASVNAAHAPEFRALSTALAAQRQRTDFAPKEARRMARAPKRPRWGDAYEVDEDDEGGESSSSEEGDAAPAEDPDALDFGPDGDAPGRAVGRAVGPRQSGPTFPEASALGRQLASRQGDGVVHLEVFPVPNIIPNSLTLPPLPRRYLAVPSHMPVAALCKLLAQELDVPPEQGSVVMSEGAAPLAAWATLGSLRQRADVRGTPLLLHYARGPPVVQPPPHVQAAAPPQVPVMLAAGI